MALAKSLHEKAFLKVELSIRARNIGPQILLQICMFVIIDSYKFVAAKLGKIFDHTRFPGRSWTLDQDWKAASRGCTDKIQHVPFNKRRDNVMRLLFWGFHPLQHPILPIPILVHETHVFLSIFWVSGRLGQKRPGIAMATKQVVIYQRHEHLLRLTIKQSQESHSKTFIQCPP